MSRSMRGTVRATLAANETMTFSLQSETPANCTAIRAVPQWRRRLAELTRRISFKDASYVVEEEFVADLTHQAPTLPEAAGHKSLPPDGCLLATIPRLKPDGRGDRSRRGKEEGFGALERISKARIEADSPMDRIEEEPHSRSSSILSTHSRQTMTSSSGWICSWQRRHSAGITRPSHLQELRHLATHAALSDMEAEYGRPFDTTLVGRFHLLPHLVRDHGFHSHRSY